MIFSNIGGGYRRRLMKAIYSSGGSPFTPLENLTARLNFPSNNGYFKTDIVLQPGDWFKIKVCQLVHAGTAYIGSRQVSNTDQNCVSLERSNGDRRFMAKMYGTQYKGENEMELNVRYTVIAKMDGITANPSMGGNTISSYSYANSIPMAVGGLALANGGVTQRGGKFDFFGIEIYNSNNVLIHRLIPQQNITLLDEVTSVVYSPTGGGILYGDD